MAEEIDNALRAMREEVSRRGIAAVASESCLANTTVKRFCDGDRPKYGPTVDKLLVYARGLAERKADGAAAPAKRPPRARRDSLRGRLIRAMGYDAATARAKAGVTNVAACMGVDRWDLKRYLDTGAADGYVRDCAECWLEVWELDPPDELYGGPKWALPRMAMGEWMLDEMDALEASGRLESACSIVPGGVAAAKRYAELEADAEYLDEEDLDRAPWEVGRAARLALGCANPMERSCATLTEYAAKLASRSLPATAAD